MNVKELKAMVRIIVLSEILANELENVEDKKYDFIPVDTELVLMRSKRRVEAIVEEHVSEWGEDQQQHLWGVMKITEKTIDQLLKDLS